MQNVAVVGAGVFGSEIAIQIAKRGHRVQLFEKKSDILREATANSQNRLHLGLHYPRDLETAIQSVKGYAHFVERFPTSVRNNFANYYGLASLDSKVSVIEYQEFAKLAGIQLKEVSKVRELDIVSSKLDRVWACSEGVIDIDILRNLMKKELIENGVKVHLNTEITECEIVNSAWNLSSANDGFHGFDSVVRTTYGLDRIVSSTDSVIDREFEYHHTLVLEVKSKNPTVGFTVIDGDFITLLPHGFSDDFLLYAPTVSVRSKYQGPNYPIEWDASVSSEFSAMEEALILRAKEWFPSFNILGKPKRKITVRSIQPNVSATDKRTSQVKLTAEGFYDVWSGKIDHCVDVAQEVVGLVSAE
jgi:glycine/D-amino acid oxidase-like deaminating enzyme